jgi:hypothetical protein
MAESFEVIGEPASLKSLHGTITAEDAILSICETVTEFEMQWEKLKRVTSDLAPSIIYKKAI